MLEARIRSYDELMLLRAGLNHDRAVADIRQAVNTLRQATQTIGGAEKIAYEYVRAVSEVKRILRGTFVDVPTARLRTPRFWAINALESVRLIEMVNDERDVQTAWLEGIATQVANLGQRFAGDSAVAVLDTHILLHYRLFIEVDWLAVVGASSVRLVVPLRVVDELDEKKAARRNDIRDRARTVLRHLEERFGTEIRPAVSIEVVALAELDPDVYREPRLPVDVEIIELCDGLVAYAGPNRTYLVTGDLGMRLRARIRSVPVREMPDKWSLLDAPEHGSA
jgi:hypothetical protein